MSDFLILNNPMSWNAGWGGCKVYPLKLEREEKTAGGDKQEILEITQTKVAIVYCVDDQIEYC